jgi:hypothetical protein
MKIKFYTRHSSKQTKSLNIHPAIFEMIWHLQETLSKDAYQKWTGSEVVEMAVHKLAMQVYGDENKYIAAHFKPGSHLLTRDKFDDFMSTLNKN